MIVSIQVSQCHPRPCSGRFYKPQTAGVFIPLTSLVFWRVLPREKQLYFFFHTINPIMKGNKCFMTRVRDCQEGKKGELRKGEVEYYWMKLSCVRDPTESIVIIIILAWGQDYEPGFPWHASQPFTMGKRYQGSGRVYQQYLEMYTPKSPSGFKAAVTPVFT